MRDESERLKAELASMRDAFARFERQMRSVMDCVPAALGYADAQQRVRFANRAFQEMSAHAGDVHGELVSTVLGKTAYEAARPAIDRVLQGERVTFEGQINVGGQLRHREVTYVPELDDAGSVLGFVGIGYDITERVIQERVLSARESHLHRVLETMSEGLVVQGLDGRILQANTAATRILGLEMDQLLGRTSLDPGWQAIREDGRPYPGEEHPAMRCLRTGLPLRGEIMGIRLRGAPVRWLSVNSQPILDADSGALTGVLATFVDVTESRSSFERVRELLARLDLAQEQERRAVALNLHEGVAQDLYAMRLLLRMFAQRTARSPETDEMCSTLDAALEKTMADVRQVVSGLRPTGLDHLRVGEAIRRHADYFQELSDLIITVVEEGAPRQVNERTRLVLFRAAQEALTNVSRHANARQVRISLRWQAAQVQLCVADDGAGISAAALNKPGALGLLGLRERCRALAGSFSIESAGRGTELLVSLPSVDQTGLGESTTPP